ncbi:MAG: alcohol dehydrogenase family protein [Acidimicrobiia bacterium]|nr:alcohol dehydrogenase family protein [Acidimicrobiia bacterium]MDH4308999.1 alcohol dehydrogenase family protein [Acidimicrobiia bacterium]MDH5294488.1 alcohol dehydrogenase family protein [Acidimicrobiia bacterium]
MRAVLLTGHGGLDKLEYRTDVPVPVPGPGEVLIEVAACGMNNTDINTRTGWYAKSVTGPTGEGAEAGVDGSWGGGLTFPRIQGADPCGRIVDAGPDIDRSRIGERVLVDAWLRAPDGDLAGARYLGSEVDGGYAEYVVVPVGNAHLVRSDLADSDLASFPCSYATAEHMLHRAAVREGQWVLVTGASGGVGGGLIQLARRRGARVVAVTSRSKMDSVLEIGAEVVVDRADEDLAAAVLDATGGVDVFADVVGGDLFPILLETIRRGGHYTTAGAIGGPVVSLDLRTLYLNDLTFHGATVLPRVVFEKLIGYIERGEIRPIVAATFPLVEMAAAQEAFMAKRHVGSIVVEVAAQTPEIA